MAYVLYRGPGEYKFKVIAQVIENIRLLTKKYPSRDELIDELNANMFEQINTRAFNELVYYLSNLEYMAKTEEMFVNWPPIDDTERCVKIIEHVTKLNNIYEGANIPILTPTQLFLAEGFKIMKFFLKWSELCMLEHLRTLPNIFPQILHRIKPNNHPAKTEVMIKAMRVQVAGINIQIRSMINKFIEKKKLKENELSIIKENQEELLFETRKTTLIFSLLKLYLKYFPESLETEHNLISKLIQYSREFQSSTEIFDEIEKVRARFINENNVLVHDKEGLKVPDKFEHIVKNADTLDWFEYFFGLKIFLENRIQDLATSSRKRSEASEMGKQLIHTYSEVRDTLEKKIDAFKSELKKINDLL